MNDSVSYSPRSLFIRLSLKGRLLTCVGIATAIAVVTISNLDRTGLFEFITAYVTAIFMLWLALTDAESFILPNKILLMWLGCRLPLMLLTAYTENSVDIIVSSLGGALIIGLLFLVVYYFGKRTLGGGDVKLSFVMGFSLTLERVFNAVFYGLVFCAVFALIGLALKKMNRKDTLPLAPFLFVGMLAAYLIQIGG